MSDHATRLRQMAQEDRATAESMPEACWTEAMTHLRDNAAACEAGAAALDLIGRLLDTADWFRMAIELNSLDGEELEAEAKKILGRREQG